MRGTPPIRMAALSPQPRDAASAAQARARYYNSGNAFNVVYPEVPSRSFAPPAAMLAGTSPTGWQVCDQSDVLELSTAATTPLVLARYGAIRAGEVLLADFAAGSVVCYVIAGSGRSNVGEEVLKWRAGDVLTFDGGTPVRHVAGTQGALMWVVTDEPLLAFTGLRAVQRPTGAFAPVHYPAGEIGRQMQVLQEAVAEPGTSGRAVVFSTQSLQASRNISPVLTLSFNTLGPGEVQRAHRHNSVAVTLIVQGADCHSEVAGQRCEWMPWSTMVTPAGAVHSHHNGGVQRADFLIVQDGGLHYHARTMDFAFC